MPVNTDVMDGPTVRKVAVRVMSVEDQQEFEKAWEMNFSVPIPPNVGRFRVNVFKQRGNVAMVIRYLRTQTPGLEALRLPMILKDLINEKRGLVLVVGATGSGKSTTLAAMIENSQLDARRPHPHDRGPDRIRVQASALRDQSARSGPDTKSYHNALINAMREAPDILMIGEVRDKETPAAGAALRADRPSVPVHAAREQQLSRAEPHHQFFPVRRAAEPAHDLAVV